MFEFVYRDNDLNPTTRLTSLSASLAAHVAVFAIMGIAPLFFIQGLPLEKPLVFLLAPEKMPAPKIQTPAFSSEGPSDETQAKIPPHGIAVIKSTEWTAPGKIPKDIPLPSDEYPVGTGMFDSPAVIIQEPLTGIIPGEVIRSWTGEKHAPLPVPKPPELKVPIRVGVLQPSKLIYRVDPVYPELARRMRISGIVRLEAIIDEEGNVTNVTVLSGHRTLRDAASEAVKQWKYTPTVQNGEPIPILAIINVVFKLR